LLYKQAHPEHYPHYRAAHRVEAAAYQRRYRRTHDFDQRYRAANRERIRVRKRAYYEANRDRFAAYNHRSAHQLALARWRAKHSERLREASKAYYYRNRARMNAARAEYERRHPEKSRRVRKLNAPVSDLTHVQWLEIKRRFRGRCAYCGASNLPLTQDHVIPLSRGGSHTASNVVPACRPCNTAKSNRMWRLL
jgi:5-methylcytosine-specific restriction endonuclease McrA